MDFIQFLDLIVHVDKTLGTVIDQYGVYVYALLFAIVFAETGVVVMFFLPGDTLLFIGGAFCVAGGMNIWILIPLLIAAAVMGNTTNYWIGKAIGTRVFTHDYKWINRDALQKTHLFFEKHGGKTIVLSRFLPVVRTFAPFVAGVSSMSFVQFQFYNIAGAVFWVCSLVPAGYFFGNIPVIRDNLNVIVVIGVCAATLPVLLGGVWRLIRGNRKSNA
jgi:membrane-associated protein